MSKNEFYLKKLHLLSHLLTSRIYDSIYLACTRELDRLENRYPLVKWVSSSPAHAGEVTAGRTSFSFSSLTRRVVTDVRSYVYYVMIVLDSLQLSFKLCFPVLSPIT